MMCLSKVLMLDSSTITVRNKLMNEIFWCEVLAYLSYLLNFSLVRMDSFQGGLRCYGRHPYCEVLPFEINNKVKHNLLSQNNYVTVNARGYSVHYESVCHEFESCWGFNNFYLFKKF